MAGKVKLKQQEQKVQDKRYFFYNLGFHGDRFLLEFVHYLLGKTIFFVETGTNVGSTLAYVARTFPAIRCFSCEPDSTAFECAVRNADYSNVSIYNEVSQEFIVRLSRDYSDLFDKPVLFWLDAHGYGFEWPLKEEVSFITRNFRNPYILIDDFKVPGLDCFGYDYYENQECSFDYIREALTARLAYDIFYPTYTEKTSDHHALRGWGLIALSPNSIKIPCSLQDKIRVEHINMNKNSQKEQTCE